MAKRKASIADDLFEIAATLPWWAGVGLAIAAYVFLHMVAMGQFTAPASVQPGQMGQIMVQSIFKGFATLGQYILPIIFLGGAVASALGRAKRRQLISDVTQSSSAGVLDGMSWQEFEMLVGEAFRQKGFVVTETGGGGADGGIDLVLEKNREKFLVQCKQWRAFKVGVEVVRELYGIMAARGATGGYVVTSGRFTPEAHAFVSGRNISLIDGGELRTLIGGARTSPVAGGAQSIPGKSRAAHGSEVEPACPNCGSPMIQRTAKRGANAGKAFWGCTTYPACNGIRNT